MDVDNYCIWCQYLGNPRDHVVDVVPVSRTVDDDHIVDRGLHSPRLAVDGVVSIPLYFKFVQKPSEL